MAGGRGDNERNFNPNPNPYFRLYCGLHLYRLALLVPRPCLGGYRAGKQKKQGAEMIYIILLFSHSFVMLAGFVLAAAIGTEKIKLAEMEIFRLRQKICELEAAKK